MRSGSIIGAMAAMVGVTTMAAGTTVTIRDEYGNYELGGRVFNAHAATIRSSKRGKQAKPAKRPNMRHVSRRTKRKHRRAA